MYYFELKKTGCHKRMIFALGLLYSIRTLFFQIDKAVPMFAYVIKLAFQDPYLHTELDVN
jgi:hypothetical protein